MDSYEKALGNGIYLYFLPTCMNAGRVCIDWINSVGCPVKIDKNYKGQHINLTVVIERYDKATRKVYFVGYEKGIYAGDLIMGKIGEIFAPTQPIAITHPHTIPYFLNLEDAYKYAAGSDQKVLLICPICGQTHEMIIKNFINQGFTCTNKNCQNSWNYKTSENQKGEKSHKWQGGITPIRKHLRIIIEPFMEAHKRSLNYTCELTGKKGNMNGHHIYPFINIVHDAHDKNNITIKPNVCDYTTEELKALEDYVLSWHVVGDWSNMILLAKDVHNQFHKEYGKVYDSTLTFEAAHKFMEEFKIIWSSAE